MSLVLRCDGSIKRERIGTAPPGSHFISPARAMEILGISADPLRHYTPTEQRRGLERLAADVEGNGWDHVDTSHD